MQLSKPTNLTKILGLRLQEFHAGACKLSYTLWGDNAQSWEKFSIYQETKHTHIQEISVIAT